jgi:anthranilate synthase component 1
LRWAGYFGYDAVRYIEKKLEHSCPPDTPGSDILLLQCEELAVIDNLSGKLYLITTPTWPCPRRTLTPKAAPGLKSSSYSVTRLWSAISGYPAERDPFQGGLHRGCRARASG